MTRLLLLLILAALPSFCASAPPPGPADTPQILAGSLQVIAEPEPWVASVDPALNTVEASLIDTAPEIVVGNTMMFRHGSMSTPAVFAAMTMLVLGSIAGAFVAGARV